jgi:GT2 family glycosyltransferase
MNHEGNGLPIQTNGQHPAPPIIGVEALTPTTDSSPSSNPRRDEKGVPWRVAAVIPGFGKHKDVVMLLRDMGRLDLRGIDFWVTLVDNATPDRPLSDIPAPAHLRLEHLRLPENTGGAGGFNAGMRRVLSGEGLSGQFDPPDFVWLVDSDARVSRNSLRELVKALAKHKKLCAVGSALVDPVKGLVYEIGGRISRTKGEWHPACGGNPDRRIPLRADYLAACSALARREAIEKTGLLPDVFIHGDDVMWFLRMQKATGQRVAGIPSSRVFHPSFLDKFQTWTRYYGCRNSFACIDAMGLGRITRFRKGMVETKRAVCQAVMGLDELADLHLDGMRDALAGRLEGHHIPAGRQTIINSYRLTPIKKLAENIKGELAGMRKGARVWVHPLLLSHPRDFKDLKHQARQLGAPTRVATYWRRRDRFSFLLTDTLKAMWRCAVGPTADIAVVPTGLPTSWFRGRVLYEVTPDGYLRREIRRGARVNRAARVCVRGLMLSIKLGAAEQVPKPALVPVPKRPAIPPRVQSKTTPGATTEPRWAQSCLPGAHSTAHDRPHSRSFAAPNPTS